MEKANIKIKIGGNSMHSISHPPFIKKPSLMQYYTLFASYFRNKENAVYFNEQT